MGDALRIGDFTDNFDPFTALMTIGGEGHIVDPFPELARLRRLAPVHALDLQPHFGAPRHVTIGDRKCYTILGFDEVHHVLTTPQDFPNKIYESNLGITFGKTITAMDPPEHLRYRKLFQAAFVPKMLESLRPRFLAVIDRLIAGFAGRGRADLVAEFALHFPFQFIMDLMDMPMDQRPIFHKIAVAQMCVFFDRGHGVEASRLLGDYLTQLVDERRAQNSDSDFVSVIANAEVDGQRLPQEVVVSFLRQLMNAGGDTSYHGFSNVLTALFTHADQLEALRNDRSLVAQTIEECLRWNGPLVAIVRGSARDLDFAGVRIDAGSYLHVAIGAANRDEKRWADPDRFDIRRQRLGHVAFGMGPHICIGQHLARLELVMALNTLLDRLPNLRLDPDMPPPEIRGMTLRGAHSVHVRFG